MAIPLETRWVQREAAPEAVVAVAKSTALAVPIARVLVGRDISAPDAAERYLRPRLSHLPDPGRLKGIDAAVDRLRFALEHHEVIGIFGDYDVDGVTSTTLLWEFLESIGAKVLATLPDRLIEGYGLSKAGVDRLADGGAKLIVTVDCGVTARDEVAYAAEKGIDVIVIDHHTVPVDLPAAVALINPHRPDDDAGAEHLCAVGVTFQLCAALRRTLREAGAFSATAPEPDLRRSLDLVALGTVADVVPLIDDNRAMVMFGLARIACSERVGMAALLAVAGIEPHKIKASSLGFQLGPRINAAGRLGDAFKAVRLLRATSKDEADRLANMLDQENLSRRELERTIVDEAIHEIENSEEHQAARILVVGNEAWHPGVVGIVASRLSDRFGKPAVVVGEGGKGSGRSGGTRFHLHEGLCAVADTLAGFGGHAHAAGVTVRPGGLEAFRDALCSHAEDVLRIEDLGRVMVHDGPLAIDEVTEGLADQLQRAAPFGRRNPEPTFIVPNVHPTNIRELNGGHLKAIVDPRRRVEVIYFGGSERKADFDQEVDLVCVPEINEWRGARHVQLRVRDFRPHSPANLSEAPC